MTVRRIQFPLDEEGLAQSRRNAQILQIKIEDGIPIPRNTRNTLFRDGMRALEKGQSFLHPVPRTAVSNVRSSVSRMNKTDAILRGRVFTVHQVQWEDVEGQFGPKGAWMTRARIWRTR